MPGAGPLSDAQPAVAHARAALQRAHVRVAEALTLGEPGGGLTATFSGAVAELVRELVDEVLVSGHECFGAMALLAIGALGRGELGPHSDVDLVLLCEQAHAEGDPAFEEWTRELVHPLWDTGLRLNMTVFDTDGWLGQSSEDLTLCSALLDAGCLAGDQALADRLAQDARARFFGVQRASFLDRLRNEVDERHDRFGDTVYRVEPDLKHGPGGLRDLAVVEWCLIATHGEMNLVELAREEVLGRRVASILSRSRDTLLRLRAALHLAAKRTQDRLLFQYQELLPPLLGMTEAVVDDGVLVDAIEAFMQDYYRAARDLLRYGRRTCERCMPGRDDAGEEQRIDERFFVGRGRLGHYGRDPFADTPVLALEAIALATAHRLQVSGRTFDCIAEAVALSAADNLVDEPEAQRRFLDLLVDPHDEGALELCNELRLLERIIPEFGPSRGRMQHEGYHVYTVDQHTLYAVAFLKGIARGEHMRDHPLATALHLELEDPRVLYLAMLLHDVGKALGGDQCETGAKVAEAVARRFGLGDEDVRRCSLLVGEHLTMPLLSQKRDLSDPLLIKAFATCVERPETLRELYLLSLADMAMVSPKNLTSWKLTLLDELYLLTSAYLRRGTALGGGHRARPDEPQGMPDRYYALFDVEMRRHHARLIEKLEAEHATVVLDLERGSGALRLTLVAQDRPALLAQVAALFDDYHIDVVAADVFSVPGATPLALDVFRLEPKHATDTGLDVASLTEMERALGDGMSSDELAAPPPPLHRPRWRRQPRAPTRVRFDRDPGGARTIVEVETLDQPGVLRRVTLAFASLGIEVLLARCLTEARRVYDVFYVPVLDEDVQGQLAERLEQYLGRER